MQSFATLVERAESLLERRERVTERFLARHLELEADVLDDLKHELLVGRRTAASEAGGVLVWRGRSAPRGVGERRQLTVLFCDLVDATRLSSRLDPEDYGELLGAYQRVCREVVEQFEGHVAQVLGDGLLVYCGYPVAHEDAAERALRIGIGILEAMRVLNETRADPGDRLAVRIGIHTGLVVVGDAGGGGGGGDLALGQAPNVAARLQALASPDTVLLSDSTRRLVEGKFRLVSQGRHLLKGLPEPLLVHRLRDGLWDAAAQAGPALRPLIGREAELARLRAAWAAARDGEGRSFVVTGEAGVGKSRLVQALRDEVRAEGGRCVELQGSPYHRSTPLHPLRSHARALGDGVGSRLEGWSAALQAALASADGHTDSTTAERAASAARGTPLALELLRKGLDEELARGPLLVLVEDAQWLDPSTSEWIEGLGAGLGRPLLVLSTVRALAGGRWGARDEDVLWLHGLERPDVAELVARIGEASGGPALPVDEIVARADGVPLFAEQLALAAIEVGSASAPVPTTLSDSLMARLDRLGEAKIVAQHAAVAGREFAFAWLEALSPLPAAQIEQGVAALVAAGILERSPTGEGGACEFRHALLRDAAYESLLRRDRRELHGRLAGHLTRPPAGTPISDEVVAYHYSEANRPREAAVHWQRAGERAFAASAYVEAASHFRRALDALAELEGGHEELRRREVECRLNLGRSLAVTQGWGSEEVQAVFQCARDTAEQSGDWRHHFLALSGLRTHYVVRGRLHRGQQYGEELLRLAERSGSAAEVFVASSLAGDTLARLGRYPESLEQLRLDGDTGRAPSSALSYAAEDPLVHRLGHLAITSFMVGEAGAAGDAITDAIARARRLDHPVSLAYALRFAAELAFRQGDLRACLVHAKELASVAEEEQLAPQGSMARLFAAWGAGHRARASEALEEYVAAGTRLNLPVFLGLMADLALRTGDPLEGLRRIEQALAVAEETGEHGWDAELWRLRGDAMDAGGVLGPDRPTGGGVGSGDECYGRAREIAKAQGARAIEVRARQSLSGW